LIFIPSKFRFRKILNGNSIGQLIFPETEWGDDAISDGLSIEINTKKIWISSHQKKKVPDGFDDALLISDGRVGWSDAGKMEKPKWKDLFLLREDVMSRLGGNLRDLTFRLEPIKSLFGERRRHPKVPLLSPQVQFNAVSRPSGDATAKESWSSVQIGKSSSNATATTGQSSGSRGVTRSRAVVSYSSYKL
jgi:hypothetical protein